MTEKEMLEEFYEETMDLIFRTSDNYLMTVPIKGLEAEWRKAKEKAELLKNMVERMLKDGKENGNDKATETA